MRIVQIIRNAGNERLTLGSCTVFSMGIPLMSCFSLERGWLSNQANVSCVPPGEYKLVWEYSPRFNTNLWELKGVPGRSEAKFHSANHWHQLNGCIALGRSITDFDGDGYPDLTASKQTMAAFHKIMAGVTEAKLIIKKSNNYNGLI